MRLHSCLVAFAGLAAVLPLAGCERSRASVPASVAPAQIETPRSADDPIVGDWHTPGDGSGDPTASVITFLADGSADWLPSRAGRSRLAEDRSLEAQMVKDGLTPPGPLSPANRILAPASAPEVAFAGRGAPPPGLDEMYRAFKVTWSRRGDLYQITTRFDREHADAKKLLGTVTFRALFGNRLSNADLAFPPAGNQEGVSISPGTVRYYKLRHDRLIACDAEGETLYEGEDWLRQDRIGEQQSELLYRRRTLDRRERREGF